MIEVQIITEFIKLDSFLKFSGACTLGSEAKFFIQNGEVKVNNEVETQRCKKLYKGDSVEFQNEIYSVV